MWPVALGALLSAELLTSHSLVTDKGPLEGALAVYQLAVEEQGRNGGAIHGRMEQNKFGHALQVVAQQESERDAAVGYTKRGNAYQKKGDLDRAIADYDKAIELDPRSALAFNNRGNAYGKNGDLDRAIADVKKAIELDPKLMLLVSGIILAQSLFYAVVVFVVARKRKINPWGWTIAALVPFIGFVVAAVFFLVTLLSILDHLNRLEARTGNMGQGLQSIRDTEKT